MSNKKETFNPATKASQIVSFLSEVRQNPYEIDKAFENGLIEPIDVVMTSIGNWRHALITPYYGGIQHANKLRHRIIRARTTGRPLVESMVTIGEQYQQKRIAAVTIRYTSGLLGNDVLQSAWKYEINANTSLKSPWDMINQIRIDCENGVPVENQSGLVKAHIDRLEQSRKWVVSERFYPSNAVEILGDAILELTKYKKL